jgi:hypothetical protein
MKVREDMVRGSRMTNTELSVTILCINNSKWENFRTPKEKEILIILSESSQIGTAE